MKIQVVELTTKKPLTNIKIQLQVKGRDSGYLSFTTDGSGSFELEDKYRGQQIGYYLRGTEPTQWITASDGVKLMISEKEMERERSF